MGDANLAAVRSSARWSRPGNSYPALQRGHPASSTPSTGSRAPTRPSRRSDSQLGTTQTALQAPLLRAAREDFRLPEDLYADNLKNVGLTSARRELWWPRPSSPGTGDPQPDAGAGAVESRTPTVSDYRDVIRALKKDQLPTDRIGRPTTEVIGQIEDIIRHERIVLPQRDDHAPGSRKRDARRSRRRTWDRRPWSAARASAAPSCCRLR